MPCIWVWGGGLVGRWVVGLHKRWGGGVKEVICNEAFGYLWWKEASAFRRLAARLRVVGWVQCVVSISFSSFQWPFSVMSSPT
jgi:hypothetical protein